MTMRGRMRMGGWMCDVWFAFFRSFLFSSSKRILCPWNHLRFRPFGRLHILFSASRTTSSFEALLIMRNDSLGCWGR